MCIDHYAVQPHTLCCPQLPGPGSPRRHGRVRPLPAASPAQEPRSALREAGGARGRGARALGADRERQLGREGVGHRVERLHGRQPPGRQVAPHLRARGRRRAPRGREPDLPSRSRVVR